MDFLYFNVNMYQVLRVLKTRQVTYSVLNHLIDYVQNLEKVGLLEKKEMVHLQEAVQVPLEFSPLLNDDMYIVVGLCLGLCVNGLHLICSLYLSLLMLITPQIDLKKLLRNPPLVKIPKAGDLISLTPLLGALPPTTRKILVGSTKETMKLRGSTLYMEGSKPNGIWIIANGVVKVMK